MTHGNTVSLVLPDATHVQLNGTLTTVLLPSFYTLIVLVGLPANSVALWLLAMHVEKLPSTIFLMNLAGADLLLGLLLPLKISYYFLGHHWPFGEGLCRFTTAAFYGNMYCSLLLLTCISVDRYIGVAHPFFARSCRSLVVTAASCTVVWVAAALATLPLLLRQQSFPLAGTNRILCHDVLPQDEETNDYFVCLVVFAFAVPLVVMVLCSGGMLWVLLRSGPKYITAVKLTTLVLFTAVVFFTPSNVLLLLHHSSSCRQLQVTFYLAYMIGLAVSTCNSCADPFVYYYVSEEFRAKVRRRIYGQQKASSVSLKTSKDSLPPKDC